MSNRAKLFNLRENIIKGSKIMCKVIVKQRLTVCVGYNSTKLKIDLIFFLSIETINREGIQI